MTNTTFTNYDEIIKALEAARKERATWEAGKYAASCDALHALLASSLDIFQACIADPNLTDGITAMLQHFKLQHSKNTSLELKVIRTVFADEATQKKHKYRLLSYARTLSFAHEAGQTPATLAQFIKDAGGIDEIRRGSSAKSNELKSQQYVTVAKKHLTINQQPGLFDAFTLPPELKPANGNRFSIAVIRDNQDGTGTIVHGLNSNAVVEKALEEVGKATSKQIGEQAAKRFLTGATQHQAAAVVQANAVIQSALNPAVSLADPVEAAE